VCVMFKTFSERYFSYSTSVYFLCSYLLLHLRNQKVISYIPSTAVILKRDSRCCNTDSSRLWKILILKHPTFVRNSLLYIFSRRQDNYLSC
jgi:hypothetical protein